MPLFAPRFWFLNFGFRSDFVLSPGDAFAEGDLMLVVRTMAGEPLAEVRAAHAGFLYGWTGGVAFRARMIPHAMQHFLFTYWTGHDGQKSTMFGAALLHSIAEKGTTLGSCGFPDGLPMVVNCAPRRKSERAGERASEREQNHIYSVLISACRYTHTEKRLKG